LPKGWQKTLRIGSWSFPGRRQRPIDAARSFREKADDPLPCDRYGLRRARFSLTRFATPIAGKDGLTRDSSRTVESIAARGQKTERSIRMTLSLAFLSPALVKAAIEGRLSAALASSV
jgi:site-specific DNA recombinase